MKLFAGVLVILGLMTGAAQAAGGPEFTVNLLQPLRSFDGPPIQNLTKSDARRLVNAPVRFGFYDAGRYVASTISGVHFVKRNQPAREIANCRQYFSATAQGFKPENNFDNKMASYLVEVCGVLRATQKAQRPRQSFIDRPHVGLRDVDIISAAILPGLFAFTQSDNTRMRSQTVREFARSNKCTIAATEVLLKVTCHGELLSVSAFARADFKGNGREGILVWAQAYATEGSFYYAGPFAVLSRASRSERLSPSPLN